jgi:hypothetical protein
MNNIADRFRQVLATSPYPDHAHPEDRGANIVIFKFYHEAMADEGQVCTAPAGPACEEP